MSEKKISSQMLKGILLGCMLIILSEKECYGYSLSAELERYGFQDIPKGTIYPLLLNMEKKGLIESEMRTSPDGPERKYYFTTPQGIIEKENFISEWQSLSASVQHLINGELLF